MYYIIIEYISS